MSHASIKIIHIQSHFNHTFTLNHTQTSLQTQSHSITLTCTLNHTQSLNHTLITLLILFFLDFLGRFLKSPRFDKEKPSPCIKLNKRAKASLWFAFLDRVQKFKVCTKFLSGLFSQIPFLHNFFFNTPLTLFLCSAIPIDLRVTLNDLSLHLSASKLIHARAH